MPDLDILSLFQGVATLFAALRPVKGRRRCPPRLVAIGSGSVGGQLGVDSFFKVAVVALEAGVEILKAMRAIDGNEPAVATGVQLFPPIGPLDDPLEQKAARISHDRARRAEMMRPMAQGILGQPGAPTKIRLVKFKRVKVMEELS